MVINVEAMTQMITDKNIYNERRSVVLKRRLIIVASIKQKIMGLPSERQFAHRRDFIKF